MSLWLIRYYMNEYGMGIQVTALLAVGIDWGCAQTVR